MKADKVWFDDGKIFISTDRGLDLWQSLLWYPRLNNATDDQRSNYRLTPFGIRWDQIDQDIRFESFTFPDKEPTGAIVRAMQALPEINASQLARRIGISQSILAAYISAVPKFHLHIAKQKSRMRCPNWGRSLSTCGSSGVQSPIELHVVFSNFISASRPTK